MSNACYKLSKYSVDKAIPSVKVVGVMKENSRRSELSWQYFGSRYGSFISYPAKSKEFFYSSLMNSYSKKNQKICDEYDPRLRCVRDCS